MKRTLLHARPCIRHGRNYRFRSESSVEFALQRSWVRIPFGPPSDVVCRHQNPSADLTHTTQKGPETMHGALLREIPEDRDHTTLRETYPRVRGRESALDCAVDPTDSRDDAP